MSGQKVTHFIPTFGTPYARITNAAIAIYGGKCEWCGISNVPLEFDHILGGGEEHRIRERANTVKRRIAIEGKRLTDVHLQLLCSECHRSKSGLENGIRRLSDRGVYVPIKTNPTSRYQIRTDASLILRAILGAVVAIAILSACNPDKSTGCQDGTHSSSTGRGTCSGHGGIKDKP